MDLAGFVIIGLIALIFLGLAGYVIHFIYRMVKGGRLTEDEQPKREGDQPKPDSSENAKMAFYLIAVPLIAIWFFFGRHYVASPRLPPRCNEAIQRIRKKRAHCTREILRQDCRSYGRGSRLWRKYWRALGNIAQRRI